MVPADVAVMPPLVTPMVATALVLLAHVPPGVASVSVAVVPWHKTDRPVIAAGNGFTVAMEEI